MSQDGVPLDFDAAIRLQGDWLVDESRRIAEEKYDVNKVNKVILEAMEVTI